MAYYAKHNNVTITLDPTIWILNFISIALQILAEMVAKTLDPGRAIM
jgi:hypothetical protein